jgi:hypothetical protein
MKQKLHTIVITVRMDKPCPQYVALREVRDCIHGEFYTTPRDDGDPEKFKVVRFTKLPKEARR